MLNNKMLNFKVYVPLLGLLFALFAIVACMETTSPESSGDYNLNVRVVQINPTNPSVQVPLQNVTIRVSPSDGTAPIVEQLTNDQGIANFLLEVPVLGRNFDVLANYNNRFLLKSNVLICRDTLVLFVFDTATVNSLDCNANGGQDSVIFFNENLSRFLQQNSPVGINFYNNCYSLINLTQTQENLRFVIPDLNHPAFFIESISISGSQLPANTREVIVPYGQVFTICFGARTNINAGEYNHPFVLNIFCGTLQQQWTLHLNSTIVLPSCTCNDITNSLYELVLSQRVQVGTNQEQEEVVFTNTIGCQVTISQVSFQGNNAWTILSPQFPVTLNNGESLRLRVRFTPPNALPNQGVLRLNIRPQGSTQDCPYEVRLTGQGCSPACPLISKNRITSFITFGTLVYTDTVSNRNDNRVFLNVTGLTPNENTTASMTYYVFNPDTACGEVNVNVNVTFADDFARRYFTVSPNTLRLAPGEIGTVNVLFVAPTFEEFEQIYTARNGNQRLIDSLFRIQVRLTALNCTHTINDIAVVTGFPDISPIINLRAYQQRTPQKSVPENEVYIFGQNARTINKGPSGELGEYPPLLGDIWIDVDNNDASANPPQEPVLKTVSNLLQRKVWRSNYSEADFSNVGVVFNQFLIDPNFSTGYTTGELRGIQVGDVIAFKFSESLYALIYIRRVDNGTENTSSKQSGIEFRSIYPIYLAP